MSEPNVTALFNDFKSSISQRIEMLRMQMEPIKLVYKIMLIKDASKDMSHLTSALKYYNKVIKCYEALKELDLPQYSKAKADWQAVSRERLDKQMFGKSKDKLCVVDQKGMQLRNGTDAVTTSIADEDKTLTEDFDDLEIMLKITVENYLKNKLLKLS